MKSKGLQYMRQGTIIAWSVNMYWSNPIFMKDSVIKKEIVSLSNFIFQIKSFILTCL